MYNWHVLHAATIAQRNCASIEHGSLVRNRHGIQLFNKRFGVFGVTNNLLITFNCFAITLRNHAM